MIGCYDNTSQGTIKSRDEGAWASNDERINAYTDTDYFTPEQSLNRTRGYTGATLGLPASHGELRQEPGQHVGLKREDVNLGFASSH